MKNEKIYSIDVMRLLASISVVIIHFHTSDMFGINIKKKPYFRTILL